MRRAGCFLCFNQNLFSYISFNDRLTRKNCMKYLYLILLITAQISFSQVSPDWNYSIEDSLISFTINDFYVGNDETIFAVGQKLKENNSKIYITAVTKDNTRPFEITAGDVVSNDGLFISPADTSAFVVCGTSEDGTGTFNFITVKFSKDGNVLWEKIFGKDDSLKMDIPADVETDTKGNLIVAGSSSSTQQQYTVVHYSPDGNLNWSIRRSPFITGQFEVRDIITDGNDNIYGITRNTFVEDTLHGTIFKINANGNLLWEKSYDIYFSDEPSEHLVLQNDTLYAAGTLFTEGSSSSTIVCVSLTSEGELVSYRRLNLPGEPAQQFVRDLKPLTNDFFILANESFKSGDYFLNIFLLTKNFEILYSDSVKSRSSIKAIISPAVAENKLSVYIYGSELKRIDYTISLSGNVTKTITEFDTEAQLLNKIFIKDSFIYTLSWNVGFPFTTSTFKRYNQNSTGVNEVPKYIPTKAMLYPAYPNPFNPTTKIKFALPMVETSYMTSLRIYNILGKEIITLINKEQPAGEYEVELDGSSLPSGIYFYTLQSGSFTETKKMILLK